VGIPVDMVAGDFVENLKINNYVESNIFKEKYYNYLLSE